MTSKEEDEEEEERKKGKNEKTRSTLWFECAFFIIFDIIIITIVNINLILLVWLLNFFLKILFHDLNRLVIYQICKDQVFFW